MWRPWMHAGITPDKVIELSLSQIVHLYDSTHRT